MKELTKQKKKQKRQDEDADNDNRCISKITNDQIYSLKRLKLFLVSIISLRKNAEDKENARKIIYELLVNTSKRDYLYYYLM